MTEVSYEEKFKKMQEHLPFLNKVIERLKVSTGQTDDNPRQAQLLKMQMLYDLLTNTGNKLKLETLLKCEGVIMKLLTKMGKQPHLSGDLGDGPHCSSKDTSKTKKCPIKIIDIIDMTGPASPPPQQIEVVAPVEIPTERRYSPPIVFEQPLNKTDRRREWQQRDYDRRNYDSYGVNGKYKDHHYSADRTYAKSKEHTLKSSNERHDRDRSQCNTLSTPNISIEREEYMTQLRESERKPENPAIENLWKETTDKEVFDLVNDSPASPIVENGVAPTKACLEVRSNIGKKSNVFERLRSKHDVNKDTYKNFIVKIPNDFSAEVLQSPPLTAMDISALMIDTVDDSSARSANLNISNIGSRRPPKEIIVSNNDKPAADLDAVRKKLALISRKSPELFDSPVSPVPTMKYTSRTVRTTMSVNISHDKISPVDPRHSNAACLLPCTRPQDPRLRKAYGLNPMPITPNQSTSNFVHSFGERDAHLHTSPNDLNMPYRSSMIDPRYGQHSHQRETSNQRFDPRLKSTVPTGRTYKEHFGDSRRASIYSHNSQGNKINHACTYGPSRTQFKQTQDGTKPTNKAYEHIDEEDWDATADSAGFSSPHIGKSASKLLRNGQKVAVQDSSEEDWDTISASINDTTVPLLAPTQQDLQNVRQITTRLPNAGNIQVSAMLNDTSERTKYLEAKKQKPTEPRTYGEFRAARARIAAEAAAKRDAMEATKKKIATQVKLKAQECEGTTGVQHQLSGTESNNLPQTSAVIESTLDKLYRSANYSSTVFPKTNTAFKIPKKTSKPIEDISLNKMKKPTTEKPADKSTQELLKTQEIAQPLLQNGSIELELAKNAKCEQPNVSAKENKCGITITECSVKEDLTTSVLSKCQPRRITKRRATMINFGSAPQVDKVKLQAANSKLYEDIQTEMINRIRSEEEPREANKKSRHLEDIFKKTDDNCTVSTQNIIIGKRRTRATVNFNEVQQANAIFKHKNPIMAKREITKSKPKTAENKVDGLESSEENATIYEKEIVAGTKTASLPVDDLSSTTTSKSNTSISHVDDNDNQVLLEQFVQNILKPNTDKEYVFGGLREILSDEKFALVMKIIEDATKQNTQEFTAIDKEEEKEANAMESRSESQLPNEVNLSPIRRRSKKRNELDRLNDDIRDMFICEGVLTATGRRMNTLVASEVVKDSSTNKLMTEIETKKKLSKIKGTDQNNPEIGNSDTTPPPRIRKSKVVLSPINLPIQSVRRSKRKETPSTETTHIDHEIHINNELDALSSLDAMPVEKRGIPFDQTNDEIGADESLLPKQKKRKLALKLGQILPCPKSKKRIALTKVAKQQQKIKSRMLFNRIPPKAVSEKCSTAITDIQEQNTQNIETKNINPNWHAQSKHTKACIVCKKSFNFMALHYKLNHSENFVSRLSPSVLELYKKENTSNPVYVTHGGSHGSKIYLIQCPFCLQYKPSELLIWLSHLSTHTGEYNFECSQCGKSSNKRAVIQKHVKAKGACFGARNLENNIYEYNSKQTVVKAHVCHLCNFVQLSRDNINRHYKEQHGSTAQYIEEMGYVIKLFDSENVKNVDMKRASEINIEMQSSPLEMTVDNADYGISPIRGDSELKDEKGIRERNKKNPEQSVISNTLPVICTPVGAESIPNIQANVFIPTRESNDSPTLKNLRLCSMEEGAADQSSEHQSVANKQSTNCSIAERLSQRFKDLTEEQGSKTSLHETVTGVMPDPSIMVSECHNNHKETKEVNAEKVAIGSTVSDTMPFEQMDFIDIKPSQLPDDDDWEDIEIIESAPSISSSSSSSRGKKKHQLQKLNRFYTSIALGSKSKKVSSPTVSVKRKVSGNQIKMNEAEATDGTKTEPKSTISEEVKQVAESLAFRPMITRLEDLLPDSPCNDPIDLVPELAPREPLQDLNDISSLLDSNFNMMDEQHLIPNLNAINDRSICINTHNQQTSIQEALDFIKEQQQKQRDSPANIANDMEVMQSQCKSQIPEEGHLVIHRIQNIGYSVSGKVCEKVGQQHRFYCLSDECSFLYSNEAIGLENHYLIEHAQTKWSGYCSACHQQVDGNECSPSRELRHILDKHLRTAASPATQEKAELEMSPTEESAQAATSDEVGDRPRIKIRRLPGDWLSTTPTLCSVEERRSPHNIIGENAKLYDLLIAQPRPPSKLVDVPNMIIESHTANRTCMDTSENQVAAHGSAPLKLQIVSAVSLNDDTTANTINPGLPKITNMCSLSTKAGKQPSDVSGSRWSQKIQDECVELAKSAADSLEGSRLLANANIRNAECKSPTENRPNNDSPEPMMVAETMPVAQATSGNFVITQTVSAHYDHTAVGSPDTQLGFNISIATAPNIVCSPTPKQSPSTAIQVRQNGSDTISSGSVNVQKRTQRPRFICRGKGCKYQTRVIVAMKDHLLFHERRSVNFMQRDYMGCALCDYIASDINDYFQHSSKAHQIDKLPAVGITSKSSRNSSVPDESTFKQSLELTIAEMTETTGIPDSELYRCVFEGCKRKLDEKTYYTHLLYHETTLSKSNQANQMYKCLHCYASYNKSGITAHIQSHARHRYFCYLCMSTAANAEQILKHFSEKHWSITNLQTFKLLEPSLGEAIKTDTMVAFDQKLSALEVQEFREKLIVEWQRKQATSKMLFTTTQIDLLPTNPIFLKEAHCAECAYKTKVRTNMLRHLLLHRSSTVNASGSANMTMASVDPVNPVPCLNSSERHFDKMTNLASSSLVPGATATNISNAVTAFKLNYAYIVGTRRFTCGVPRCHSLTITEEIFRSHLNALHGDITQYQCPFCKVEVCKRSISAERIVQHLRFHGEKLYRCEQCNYFHYMKSVVERHIHERHSEQRVNLITHTRAEDNAEQGIITMQSCLGKRNKDSNVKANKNGSAAKSVTLNTAKLDAEAHSVARRKHHKWVCGLCGNTATTQQQIVAHCQTQHGQKQQYECAHCSFGAQQLSQILSHIDVSHVNKPREALHIYHKLPNNAEAPSSADTRPLWQRDDPKRVRHIRGILMENEEESEQHRRGLSLDDDDSVDDRSVDVAPVATALTSHPSGTVSDFDPESNSACTKTGADSAFVGRYEFGCFHCNYVSKDFIALKHSHWEEKHKNEPFLCRPLALLKCALCTTFLGNHFDLQVHLQNDHNTHDYMAVDPHSPKPACGYCFKHYTVSACLVRHHRRELHRPHDLKQLKSHQLEGMLLLGIPSKGHIQCGSCSELFTKEIDLNLHMRIKHNDDISSGKRRQVKNTLLYCCPMCKFTAPEELLTLRHMIDHYGRFNRCHFCQQPQTNFNGYMQHCYADHREGIKEFSRIYTLENIREFLQQMYVMFPNGLVVDKKNLCYTKYGSEARANQLYLDICKIAKEPPIPRLSIARLVARKSIEVRQWPDNNGAAVNTVDASRRMSQANEDESVVAQTTAAAMQLAGNGVTATAAAVLKAKKICKRRSTVAAPSMDKHIGRDESPTFPHGKKRKTVQSMLPLAPTFAGESVEILHTTLESEVTNSTNKVTTPYSFYGTKPEAVDWTNVHTKIAIAGQDTPLSLSKFKMLFNINSRVIVENSTNGQMQRGPTSSQDVDDDSNYRHVKKPCPRSHKYKYLQK